MSRNPPTLTSAIEGVVLERLDSSADRWIRVELPGDWPIVSAITSIADVLSSLRIGVLQSCLSIDLSKVAAQVTREAPEITRWRNQSVEVRAQAPTIVLGDALGQDEAGLRALPNLVQIPNVIDRWRRMIIEWLDDNVHSETPKPLFEELFTLTEHLKIDANRLDQYIQTTLSKGDHVLSALRESLWIVNILPDSRVLDTNRTHRRLRKNLKIREDLRTAIDGDSHQRMIHNLRSAAANGDEVAQRALNYRHNQVADNLKGVELEHIEQLLKPAGRTTRNATSSLIQRSIGLFALLDQAEGKDPAAVLQVLKSLGNSWERSSTKETLRGVWERDGEGSVNVQVSIEPRKEVGGRWIESETPCGQNLVFMVEPHSQKRPDPSDFVTITGQDLLQDAEAQQSFTDQSQLTELVQNYLASRLELQDFEVWLYDNALELLVLREDVRRFVEQYLIAWYALVNYVTGTRTEGIEFIRDRIRLLETVWAIENDSVYWCVLGPLHPYVLEPVLRIATYALSNIGKRELGKRVKWAIDQSLPSYPVIWSGSDSTALLLSSSNEGFVFETEAEAFRPRASSGRGISQVVNSFLGFHPYAKYGLTITLVDPPVGGAIEAELREIGKVVERLRVYLVTTNADANQLYGVDDIDIQDVGRYESVSEWLATYPVRSHLVFYFAERSKKGTAAAARHKWGPTPGSHVALQIRYARLSAFDPDSKLVPFVTFAPRDNNSAVVSLHKLAERSSGAPRLFEIEPLLPSEEVGKLDKLSDWTEWIVVGAPGPLGLVPPRKLGNSTTYLGRETLGPYGLFVYSKTLFSVRKHITQGLRGTPVTPANYEVEQRIADLAMETGSGVLRIVRPNGTMWEQIGIIMSSAVARRLSDDGD